MPKVWGWHGRRRIPKQAGDRCWEIGKSGAGEEQSARSSRAGFPRERGAGETSPGARQHRSEPSEEGFYPGEELPRVTKCSSRKAGAIGITALPAPQRSSAPALVAEGSPRVPRLGG